MFSFIWFLLIGLAAGWAGTRLMSAGGANVLTMMVVGVVGSFIGPFVLGLLGFEGKGSIASFIAAVVGAVICIAAMRYFGPKL